MRSARATKAERELLAKLESEHGYVFSEVRRADERTTMHFRGNRKTGKYTLTPARVLMVSMPVDSPLAIMADAALKAKARKPKRRGGR